MADGVGFEPTRGSHPLPVFKTGAFDRSATHPESDIISPAGCVQDGNGDERLFDLRPPILFNVRSPIYAIGRRFVL